MINFFFRIYIFILEPVLKVIGRLFAKERVEFEQRNSEPRLKNIFASIEVSSEGELEQILPLILKLLDENKTIRLFYCSPSVEKKCTQLEMDNIELLECFRLPLLQFGKKSFHYLVEGSYLIMCRYDFFPILLYYARKHEIKSILISATLSGKKLGYLKKKLFSFIYSSFDYIYTADDSDLQDFRELKFEPCDSMELRCLQIEKRLNHQFKDKTKVQVSILKAFETLERDRSLTFGSCYLDELKLLSSESLDRLVRTYERLYFFPHNLNECKDIYELLQKKISDHKGKIEIINEDGWKQIDLRVDLQDTKIIVFDIKGILCEFYRYSRYAYVGGGFLKSVHSVLEPFVAGNKVFCGDRVEKSTEVRFLNTLGGDEINVLSNINLLASFQPECFSINNSKNDILRINNEKLTSLISKMINNSESLC